MAKQSRFNKLKNKLSAQGASNPGGLAAYIGRKKYGDQQFQSMATKGRRKK